MLIISGIYDKSRELSDTQSANFRRPYQFISKSAEGTSALWKNGRRKEQPQCKGFIIHYSMNIPIQTWTMSLQIGTNSRVQRKPTKLKIVQSAWTLKSVRIE
jgi:hypothetical protein